MTRRSFSSAFVAGLRGYARVPGALSRFGLWHYQLLPAFVSLALSILMLAGVYHLAGDLASWVDARVEITFHWLDTLVTWTVWILTFFTLLIAFVFLHKHIVLVVLAPFLSRLSERIIGGREGQAPRSALTALKSFHRSAIINTRSLIIELAITLGLLALGFMFPIFSPFTSALIFLIEARYVGMGLMDFALEYRGFSIPDSYGYFKQRKALATGLGLGYFLFLLVPVVGWMFAPTFGTVAGTLEAIDDLEQHRAASTTDANPHESN